MNNCETTYLGLIFSNILSSISTFEPIVFSGRNMYKYFPPLISSRYIIRTREI